MLLNRPCISYYASFEADGKPVHRLGRGKAADLVFCAIACIEAGQIHQVWRNLLLPCDHLWHFMGLDSKTLQLQACRGLDAFIHKEGEAVWRHEVIRPHQLRGLVLMPEGGCTGSHDWNEHRQTAESYKRLHERVGA